MSEKVSAKTKLLYGVASSGLEMLTSIVQFYLLFFYTEVARIDPALVGTALMAGKLSWDAINDPLIGHWSDRTRSRWGRRRPYMLFGALPLALVTFLLFSIPAGLKGTAAFLVVLFSYLLFDSFHSLVRVPYCSMTPELSFDYDERTSLTTVREVFTVIGYIIGAAATTAVVDYFMKSRGLGLGRAYSAMGAVFGLFAAVTVLVSAFGVRERADALLKPSASTPLTSMLGAFRNKPFMRLIAAGFLTSFGFTLLTSLMPYFLSYQIDMAAQMPIVMFAMLATIGIFLFPMKLVSDRIGKGRAYALGLLVACAACAGTFLLGPASRTWIYAVAVVAGMGFSAQWVCPWSMLPDVVEYDQARTGERNEGVYYGMWEFMGKFTNALGIAVSGWALSLFGYVPGAAQSARALLGIRLFFGPLPSLAILLALPLLFFYPISRASHARMVEELRAKAGAGGS